MPRAVFRNGTIQLGEPIPGDWVEGQQLRVEPVPGRKTVADLDQWFAELDAMYRAGDPEDHQRLMTAIAEIRESGKEQTPQRPEGI